MENINRRTFLGAAAMGAVAAMAPVVARADESKDAAADAAEPAEAPSAASIGVDVSDVPFGVQGLTVDQMNQIRDLIIEPKTEYVKADGTVVPEVYVKLRALFDTIGLGLGSDVTDSSYDVVMFNFTEDEAQAVLEMPRGVYFTATEFAVQSGRDEAECLALCEDLSKRGMLYRARRSGVPYFHLVAHAHGMWEYGLLGYYCNGSEDIAREYCGLHQTQWGAEVTDDFYNAETTFYYPIPVNSEVVADAEILPYDDYEKVIERNSVIGVSPCQCRLRRELQNDKAESCDHPLETCLTFGEEAEYYIENGIARQIDKDEAREILQCSIDAGMVIQSAYTKNTEVICQCHGDCCDILSSYVVLGEALNNDIAGSFNAFGNLSHYNLVVDTDACVKCGACAERCPMFAITMDDEQGPVVDGKCIKCGQCGTVCPVEARKLTVREDAAELPESMLDDYNLKSSYRLSHGMVH